MPKSGKKGKCPKENLPHVNPELKGFNIRINSMGEIEYTHSLEEINQFLNKKVVDRKLKGRLGYKSEEDDDTVEFMY